MDYKGAEGLAEDIRSTPGSFVDREGCLELFDLIENQQEKIEILFQLLHKQTLEEIKDYPLFADEYSIQNEY
jgi:hypothetical protein